MADASAAPPFRPLWWLPGPHLPTIWGKKCRWRAPVHDRVERLTTPDGDHLTLARVGTPTAGRRHLLVLHGLEGTIRAKYAHGLLASARARGWSGDLLLFRSCDGERNLARRLYHSGETSDLAFVLEFLHRETPGIDVVVCGVSLGGNVLVKWLGESGEVAARFVKRAAAVSTPFDLARGARVLEHGLGRAYTGHFLRTLKQKAVWKHAQYPGAFDLQRGLRATTFWEFDDAVTAPLHGFTGADDYYGRSSSMTRVASVRVPLLALSSLDDPIVPREVTLEAREMAAANAAVEFELTRKGGHVGWVSGMITPHYWMEPCIVEYLAL